MPFSNEYIPAIEQETSEFAKNARSVLKTGYSKHNQWTIDRDEKMVLLRTGGGHSIESAKSDYWTFIDKDGIYNITTDITSSFVDSDGTLVMTREINFPHTPGFNQPTASTILTIKEALRVYKDYGTASDYSNCRLTLIEATNGKEL